MDRRIHIFLISGLIENVVRLALLALSVVLAFAQAVVDNVNKTSLTPLAQK
ncbi:hypothetical protein [Desulfocicer niacini]